MVQGYEVHVLKSLEPKIKRITVDMEKMPEIRYRGRHWKRRYYPDALIETIAGNNVLLEVKSLFTLKKSGVISKAKAAFEFCSQYNNLSYMIALYDKTNGIRWIRSMPELHSYRNQKL